MKRLFLSIVVLLCMTSIAFAVPKNTSSFLGFKLGMSEDDFIKNNPGAELWGIPLLPFTFSKIEEAGVKFYKLQDKKLTSSGNEVDISPGFLNGKLAIIYIEYSGVNIIDLLQAFTKKYGKSTNYTKNEFNNFLVPGGASEHEIVENVYFEQQKDVIVNVNYVPRYGGIKVILADKKTQSLLRTVSKKKKTKMIEGLVD
jgi:hypothetical protein